MKDDMKDETEAAATPPPETKAAEAHAGAPGAEPAPGGEAEALSRIAELEAERDLLKEQILRTLAETENVRKRANRQIADERIYAVEKFARDMLAVADNLARAIETARDAEPGTLLEGVELTQRELHAVLSRHGVTAIEAAPGSPFDPAVHQAITQIPSDHPAGAVAQLFQSGWRIGDRTLRPAMVAVSSGS